MIALFRTELVKQVRRPRTYVALGLMAVIPIIITIALYANPPGEPNDRESLFFLSTVSGLLVPAAALEVMSRFLLIAVVSLFAGDAIASEAAWGNLRAVLVRPVRRGRLLAAKLGVVALFTFLATMLITVSGLVVGILAFGWHPLDFAPLGIHQSAIGLVGDLAFATVYVAWSLAAIAAFGFMVSAMTDTPASAIGAAFGLYVTSAILDNITAIGSIRYVFPTHYLDAWQHLFTHGTADADMARGALLQIPYLIVFCSVAWWWFGRKDILS